MEATVFSKQIAALRKRRGLTQEQLGALMGVSAQAVSKWEKGGAPDVELLPSLAEHLGVTIDTLFGCGEKELEDMPMRLKRWLDSNPAEGRLWALFRLLAQTFQYLIPMGVEIASLPNDTCYPASLWEEDGRETWMRSQFVLEDGVALGVLSENFPLYLLLPEPPEGYAQHFAENDEYRRLFAALSKPGCLEILCYLYSKKKAYYTPEAVARRVSLPLEAVQELMETMKRCNLLRQETLEVAEGQQLVYILHDSQAFVPLLYFARWLMESKEAWICGWEDRDRPILEKKGWKK